MTDYRKAAALGSIIAELRLAQIFELGGKGVARDLRQSVEWERRAAEVGDWTAQYGLAVAYRMGRGVPQDDSQADFWYRKAAAQGDEFAAEELLHVWQPHGPPPPTPEDLARAEATFTYFPPWVPQDFAKMDALARASAEAGQPYAQYILAVRYRDGLRVDGDDRQAEIWFRRAAEHGFAPAQFALAELIRDKNLAQALDWYAKAANQGYGEAEEELDNIYQDDATFTPKEPASAFAWYRKGADYGDPVAQVRVALDYERGVGTPVNYGAAVAAYRKAAEQGIPDAEKRLSQLYEIGRGLPKDLAKAYFWLVLANSEDEAEHSINPAFDAPETIKLDRRLTPHQRAQEQKRVRSWLIAHQMGIGRRPWPATTCCNNYCTGIL